MDPAVPAVLRAVLALSAAAGLVLGAPGPSRAQPVGLGVNLGEPTGLNLRLGQTHTAELTVGWSLPSGGVVGLANYLAHAGRVLPQFPLGAIHPYAGLGLGVWVHDQAGTWIQVPLGLDLRFSIPIELSLHIDPGMDIVPATRFTVHWGLGVRYWFR